jgi:transcriptional regulator with XRE-family HTH domain
VPRKNTRKIDGGYAAREKKQFAIILGQVLQEMRLEREMSLLAVAERAKISEATMCRYEHGARVDVPLHKMTLKDVNKVANKVRVPDLFTAYKIACVMGISLDQLMDSCIDRIERARKRKPQEQKGDNRAQSKER